MALNNIEIEVKLVMEKYDCISNFLNKNAKRIGVKSQKDIYFDLPASSFLFINNKNLKDANEFLRIRYSKGKEVLTYTKLIRDEKHIVKYAEEYEEEILFDNVDKIINVLEKVGFLVNDDFKEKIIKIKNADDLYELFIESDFKITAVIDKKRDSYLYKDIFEVELDLVENLGTFIEIEYAGNTTNIDEAKKELNQAIKEMDFGEEPREPKIAGYVQMYWNKK
jgi:predicted adenylyl cyclase CyaB